MYGRADRFIPHALIMHWNIKGFNDDECTQCRSDCKCNFSNFQHSAVDDEINKEKLSRILINTFKDRSVLIKTFYFPHIHMSFTYTFYFHTDTANVLLFYQREQMNKNGIKQNTCCTICFFQALTNAGRIFDLTKIPGID